MSPEREGQSTPGEQKSGSLEINIEPGFLDEIKKGIAAGELEKDLPIEEKPAEVGNIGEAIGDRLASLNLPESGDEPAKVEEKQAEVPDSLKERVVNLRSVLDKKIAEEERRKAEASSVMPSPSETPINPALPVEQASILEPDPLPTPEQPRILRRIYLAPQPRFPEVSPRPADAVVPRVDRAEATPEVAEVKENPFQKQEAVYTAEITDKGTEAEKISPEAIRAVNDFLAEDGKRVQQMFALEWFNNNEERMRKEGRVIPPGVSDEWKINMVLTSKERGGMGAIADSNDPKYKYLRQEMDKIGILRTDIARKQIPPETPAMLLNYLQERIRDKKQEISALNERADRGDASAGELVKIEEGNLKELFSARIEIAGKAVHEDLAEQANAVVGVVAGSRQERIDANLDVRIADVKQRKNEELIQKEWQEYLSLPEARKVKYRKTIGLKQDISLTQFEQTLDSRRFDSPQNREDAYKKYAFDRFKQSIITTAEKNGIAGDAFYGMLADGLKPHKAQKKGMFTFTQRTVVSRDNGVPREVSRAEWASFLERYKVKYNGIVKIRAQDELGSEWNYDEAARENNLNGEIERRIEEIARSAELAEGGVEKLYAMRSEIIVAEYIEARKAKMPEAETPERKAEIADLNAPAKVAKPEKGGKKAKTLEKPEKSTADILSTLGADTLRNEAGKRVGDLEALTGEFDKDAPVLSKYLKEKHGVSAMTPAILRAIIARTGGEGIYKKRCAENDLLYWFADLIAAKPWEELVREKAKVPDKPKARVKPKVRPKKKK